MSAREDLEIKLGETAELEFTMLNEAGDPVDLTGYEFTSVAQSKVGAADTIWSLSEGAGITVTPLTGVVKLTITLDNSVTARHGEYVVKAVDGSGVVSYPKYGALTLIPVPTAPVAP